MGDPQSAASSPHFSRRCIGYPAPLSCQSAYLQYATIIRRVRPWRRAYSRGIISHGLLYRCGELCLFKALHPAPLARPFSKGLLERDYLTWTFIPLRRVVPLRGTLSCAFGAALLQGPTRGDYLTWAFMPLRRIVPLRSTLSRDLVRLSLPRIVIPSVAEGSLLQSSSSPALLIRLHETPYPTFLAYQASRFRSHAYSISP